MALDRRAPRIGDRKRGATQPPGGHRPPGAVKAIRKLSGSSSNAVLERRGAPPARRERSEVYSSYPSDEQRSGRGCIVARTMVEAGGVEPPSGSTPARDPTGLVQPEISPSP